MFRKETTKQNIALRKDDVYIESQPCFDYPTGGILGILVKTRIILQNMFTYTTRQKCENAFKSY